GRKTLERLCHSGAGVTVGPEPDRVERTAREPGRAVALHAPRIPQRPARERQRLARKRLDAALRHALARRGADGGLPGLRQGAFLWRVRVRLGLGQRLRAAWPRLLSQGGGGGAV